MPDDGDDRDRHVKRGDGESKSCKLLNATPTDRVLSNPQQRSPRGLENAQSVIEIISEDLNQGRAQQHETICLGNDAAYDAFLLEHAMDEFEEGMQVIEAAEAEGSAKMLFAAHRLKGSLYQLGLEAMGNLAREIEVDLLAVESRGGQKGSNTYSPQSNTREVAWLRSGGAVEELRQRLDVMAQSLKQRRGSGGDAGGGGDGGNGGGDTYI